MTTSTHTVEIGWTRNDIRRDYHPMRDGWRADADRATLTIQVSHPGSDRDVAEAMFEATNLHTGLWDSLAAQLPADRDHTALSVGDQVTVDGLAYSCERAGWLQRVSADQLTNLIQAEHPGRWTLTAAQEVARHMLGEHPFDLTRGDIDDAATRYSEHYSWTAAYRSITGTNPRPDQDDEALMFSLTDSHVIEAWTIPTGRVVTLNYWPADAD